jgi:hypothetical protein
MLAFVDRTQELAGVVLEFRPFLQQYEDGVREPATRRITLAMLEEITFSVLAKKRWRSERDVSRSEKKGNYSTAADPGVQRRTSKPPPRRSTSRSCRAGNDTAVVVPPRQRRAWRARGQSIVQRPIRTFPPAVKVVEATKSSSESLRVRSPRVRAQITTSPHIAAHPHRLALADSLAKAPGNERFLASLPPTRLSGSHPEVVGADQSVRREACRLVSQGTSQMHLSVISPACVGLELMNR